MTIITNEVTTYSGSRTIREDLQNYIYMVSPTETPLLSMLGKDKADSTHPEWNVKALAAAVTTNAVIEGDDLPAVETGNYTNRVGNYCQISRKVVAVSGTDEVVKQAGMKSALAREISDRGLELKRDMESSITSDQVGVVGNSTTARKSAGLGSWIVSNWYQVATSGSPAAPQMSSSSDGYPQTAAVDGTTPVDFTETHLKNMIQRVYSSSAKIAGTTVMVGPVNKQRASGFSGIATRFISVDAGEQAAIAGGADVYTSDFGRIKIVPNLFQPENRAYLVNKEYASIAYLRPFQVVPMAKTGDATKRMLLVEFALRVKSEKAFGTVRGITTQ
jgi:hypothetical protein